MLRQLAVEEVRPFRFMDWHDGYAYFIGYKNDNKVFIKIDLFLQFLGNDHLSFTILQNKVNLLPITEFWSKNGYQVLIYPFVEGQNLTESDLIEKPSLLNDIFNTLEILNQQGLIHRDIRLENFMLINDELFIIDFTFISTLPHAMDKYDFKKLDAHDPRQKKILRKLGARINPRDYVWNDFYSVAQVIRKILNNNKSLSHDVIEALEQSLKSFETTSKRSHTTYNLIEDINS